MMQEIQIVLGTLRQAVATCAALAHQVGKQRIVIGDNTGFTAQFRTLLRKYGPQLSVDNSEFPDWERAAFTYVVLCSANGMPFVCDRGEVVWCQDINSTTPHLEVRVRNLVLKSMLTHDSVVINLAETL